MKAFIYIHICIKYFCRFFPIHFLNFVFWIFFLKETNVCKRFFQLKNLLYAAWRTLKYWSVFAKRIPQKRCRKIGFHIPSSSSPALTFLSSFWTSEFQFVRTKKNSSHCGRWWSRFCLKIIFSCFKLIYSFLSNSDARTERGGGIST